jgi:hypothetical protein
MDKALTEFIARIADRECEVEYQSEMVPTSSRSFIANQKQMESSISRRKDPSIISDANSHLRSPE